MPSRVLLDLLRGRGAHVDPVACVKGLSAELAGRPLPGAPHTIWQLVWHMNYWMAYELASLEGPEERYPDHADESWPVAAGPPSESAWEAEVERFHRHVDQLGDWVGRATSKGVGTRIAHRARGETVQDVLWQMAVHNSYHTGQVALLRRAFAAWPPAGGGDTW